MPADAVRPGTPLPDPGFAGDDGAPDAALARTLAAFARDPTSAGDVLHALAAARVLVPVVAVATGQEPGQGGLRRESATDMAVVTLQGEDGRLALPVFTGLAALAAWDPAARPVPVAAPRAALAAAAEGAAVLVLDVAGPVRFVVGPPALRRLAEGDPLVPLADHAGVRVALGALLAAEPAVRHAWLVPVAGADARLALRVAGSLDAAGVAALARRVGERLRDDPTVRAAVVLGLEVALVEGPPGGDLRRRAGAGGCEA